MTQRSPPRSRAVVRVRRLVGNTDRRQQCVAAQRHGHPAPDRDQAYQSRTDGTHSRGATVAFRTRVGAGQRSLTVRAVYFVLVGWWLSLLWANVASFLAITVGGSRSQSGCSTDCRTSRRCTGFTGDPGGHCLVGDVRGELKTNAIHFVRRSYCFCLGERYIDRFVIILFVMIPRRCVPITVESTISDMSIASSSGCLSCRRPAELSSRSLTVMTTESRNLG